MKTLIFGIVVSLHLNTFANFVIQKKHPTFKYFSHLISINYEKSQNENELLINFEFKCKDAFKFLGSLELYYNDRGKGFSIPLAAKKVKKNDHEILTASFKISKHFINNFDLRLALYQDYEKMAKENQGIIMGGSWSIIISEFIDKKDLVLKEASESKHMEEEGLDLTE